jgi:hypothetical protein
MSMEHANGVAPVIVVEVRCRPWWRQPDRVLAVLASGVLGLSAAILIGRLADQRLAAALYLAQWTLIGLIFVVWPGGRPCVGCGRWLRHRLDCRRGAVA